MHGQCSCQGAASSCPLLRLPTVPPAPWSPVCVLSQIQLSPVSRPCALFCEQALPDDSTSYPSLGMLLLPGSIGGRLPASMGVPLLKSLGSGPTCPCHALNQAHLMCPPPTRAPLSPCPVLIHATGTAFLDHKWPLALATLIPQVSRWETGSALYPQGLEQAYSVISAFGNCWSPLCSHELAVLLPCPTRPAVKCSVLGESPLWPCTPGMLRSA